MDIAVVRNAVGSLDKLLSKKEGPCVWRSGLCRCRRSVSPPTMKAFLEELHDIFLVILEAADMPETGLAH
jgi:hypothetical protein